MQPWKRLLSRLLVALVAIIALNISGVNAAQKAKKPAPPLQGSAIMGEVEDEDTISMDEDDAPVDDETEAAPPKKTKESPKPKGNKLKGNSKKDKKKDKKREKLMEGFSKAEEFHKMWFHLPSMKIKTSLDKLTKFCKIACTASQCADEEVANNCHLICPPATITKCPDPLKKPGAQKDEEEETGETDEAADTTASADAAAPLMMPQVRPNISSDLIDSINKGDNLMGEEGEGG